MFQFMYYADPEQEQQRDYNLTYPSIYPIDEEELLELEELTYYSIITAFLCLVGL